MSKQYFRAIGQQLAASKQSLSKRPVHYKTLPAWAREQIAAGYVSQLPNVVVKAVRS